MFCNTVLTVFYKTYVLLFPSKCQTVKKFSAILRTTFYCILCALQLLYFLNKYFTVLDSKKTLKISETKLINIEKLFRVRIHVAKQRSRFAFKIPFLTNQNRLRIWQKPGLSIANCDGQNIFRIFTWLSHWLALKGKSYFP